MFNSREYEWADVNVVIGGRIITGIRSVKYKESKEKEVLYGKGNKPQGIQHGNYSYDGEVTILQSELQALETAAKAAGVGSILELSMEIVVSYVDPGKGGVISTDILHGAEFTESEKGLAQGAKFMEITLPFIFLKKSGI